MNRHDSIESGAKHIVPTLKHTDVTAGPLHLCCLKKQLSAEWVYVRPLALLYCVENQSMYMYCTK